MIELHEVHLNGNRKTELFVQNFHVKNMPEKVSLTDFAKPQL